MTTKYAIFVTLQLKPGMGEAFRPHILKNAQATRQDEPDNHQFTVMVSEQDPDRYHFYEVYSNEQALDAHRQTAHFKTYAAAIEDMVLDKTVQGCHVVDG